MATANASSASIQASSRWRCRAAAAIRNFWAEGCEMGKDFGYCEINLNVGCLSDRVQEDRFGA
jgi:tRNA-dihydrouridine synthase